MRLRYLAIDLVLMRSELNLVDPLVIFLELHPLILLLLVELVFAKLGCKLHLLVQILRLAMLCGNQAVCVLAARLNGALPFLELALIDLDCPS